MSRCPLTIPLSLVVVEEVECYMLPVSTPLTGNEVVECATVRGALLVGRWQCFMYSALAKHNHPCIITAALIRKI